MKPVNTPATPRRLYRYTNLAAVIHMLRTRTLTLLDPAAWDDRNDAAFLAEYRRKKGAAAILALCFFQEQGKWHHWRGYADGMDGACVAFRTPELLSAVEVVPRVMHREVEYRTIMDARENGLAVDDLPFVKRKAYEDEKEYRVVYVDQEEDISLRPFKIDLRCVLKVVLSPRLPKSFTTSVQQTLKTIEDCSALPVNRSTLLESEAWKKCALRARPPAWE